MKLPDRIQKVEVYYDGRCGMCCSFHEWINRQPRAYSIDFIPHQSPAAERRFPGIGTLDPAREMIVRTNCKEIYRGAEAWVLCLYSCANHQALAKKLASPSLLSVAIHTCRLLAANRHTLSKVFFRGKDREVRETLHQMQAPECSNEFCVTK